MNDRPIEIECPACGQETFLLRTPLYEGLSLAGEELSCAGCGHVFRQDEDIPYKARHQQQVFDKEDRDAEVHVFEESEQKRLCRYCGHYVVNPFTQWCHRHRREVEATDACDQFEKRAEEKRENNGESQPIL